MPRYRRISLPGELVGLVEKAIRERGYRSIAEFVSEATRLRLQELGVLGGAGNEGDNV